MSGGLILPKPAAVSGTVEITRSFSYKLNTGNYESRDFFASEKAQCPVEDAERISELLYEFCKKAVLQSVKDYLRDIEAQRKKKEMAGPSIPEQRRMGVVA